MHFFAALRRLETLLFFDSSFFTSSSIVFTGSLLVNVLNYVFTLIMSRLLGTAHFGEVAALLSLMLIVSVPASTLSMLMAREVAAESVRGLPHVRGVFAYLKRRVLLATLVLWIVFFGMIPLLSEYLRLPVLPLLFFSLLVPLSLFAALYSGALQGLQSFLSLAKQSVLGTTVKLSGSVLLVYLGFAVSGVVGALVLAALLSLIYGAFLLRTYLPEESGGEEAPNVPLPLAVVGGIFFTTLLVTLLSNIDVILAKHYLSADLAGQYAALSTAGKIVTYGIGVFVTVLLPMAAHAHARGGREADRVLYLSFGFAAAGCVAASVLFFLAPDFLIAALLGGKYLSIAPELGYFSVAMGAIALSTILVNFFVATRSTSFHYPLVLGVAAEIWAIAVNHDSLLSITLSLMVSSLFLLTLLIGTYILKRRQPKSS